MAPPVEPYRRKMGVPSLSDDIEAIQVAIADLIPNPRNARRHDDPDVAAIVASIRAFGFRDPIEIDRDFNIIAGHGRRLAAIKIGLESVPCVIGDPLSPADQLAYGIANNQTALRSTWYDDLLGEQVRELAGIEGFDLDALGFTDADLAEMLGGAVDPEDDGAGQPGPSLAERFGLAPFTVLDARQGWWQGRKRAWLSLGIRSELGRGAMSGDAQATPGGSAMPAADYSKNRARGDGRGRAIEAVLKVDTGS